MFHFRIGSGKIRLWPRNFATRWAASVHGLQDIKVECKHHVELEMYIKFSTQFKNFDVD